MNINVDSGGTYTKPVHELISFWILFLSLECNWPKVGVECAVAEFPTGSACEDMSNQLTTFFGISSSKI